MFLGAFEDNKFVQQQKDDKKQGTSKPLRQKIIDEIAVILKHDEFTDGQRKAVKAMIKGSKTNEDLINLKKIWQDKLDELNEVVI